MNVIIMNKINVSFHNKNYATVLESLSTKPFHEALTIALTRESARLGSTLAEKYFQCSGTALWI